jgi:hypothetical protein
MPRGHGKPDKLQVQVALRIKAPKGARIRPEVMQQILDRIVNNEPLPPSVEVRGIFWRNPNRRGAGSHWRYAEGSDLRALQRGGASVESSSRGSLRDAASTLGGALYSGVVTF